MRKNNVKKYFKIVAEIPFFKNIQMILIAS